jgi:hypothetical protein
MFRRWQQRRSALPSEGPVDVDGIRAMIAQVLASLPPGAAHVEESRERLQNLGYLRLRVSPAQLALWTSRSTSMTTEAWWTCGSATSCRSN